MTNIAIITPCILPVPAISGGAVEVLIENIINENEQSKRLFIDVYSIWDERVLSYSYQNSRMILINKNKFCATVDKVLDKIYRTLPGDVSSSRFYDNRILREFKRRYLNTKYEVVIIENMMSTAIKIGKITKNAKLFFHMHNDVDIYRSKAACEKLVRLGYRFIAISEYIKKRILDCDSRADVTVVYNGLDKNIFNSNSIQNKPDRDIRKNDAIRFLFSGRIIPEKGVYELLQAFEIATRQYSNVELIIAGAADFGSSNLSEYEKNVFELAKKLGKKVRFTGKVDVKRMPEVYYDADIVVIPSLWEEPFGMVALEAIAMGKPVIATQSGGLTEALDDNCAIFIPNNKTTVVDDLVKAMESCLDPDKRERMGQEALMRMEVHSEFAKENYFKSFVETIKG